MHDPEMHHGFDRLCAKEVLQLLATNVDLFVFDVFGFGGKRTSINANHRALAMKNTHDILSKPSTRTRNEDRAFSSWPWCRPQGNGRVRLGFRRDVHQSINESIRFDSIRFNSIQFN